MTIAKYNIPDELIYFTNPGYAKKEILFTPVAKNADSSKKRKILNRSTTNFTDKVGMDTLVEFQITENRFIIELLEPKDFKQKIYCSGKWYVRVKVSNPDLDSGHTYLLTIPFDNFVEMVSQTDIIDKKLKDPFAIQITGTEGFSLISVNDEDYKASSDIGKILATTRKTTKWKEGHKYLFANRQEFIYLGNYYGFFHNYSNVLNEFSYGFTKAEKRYLCVNCSQIPPNKHEKLSEYFNRIVEELRHDTLNVNELLGFRKCSLAVDLGEVVEKDIIDIDSIKRNLIKLSPSPEPKDDILPRVLGISESENSYVLSEFKDIMLFYLDQKIVEQYNAGTKYKYRLKSDTVDLENDLINSREAKKYITMFNMSTEETIERIRNLIKSIK